MSVHAHGDKQLRWVYVDFPLGQYSKVVNNGRVNGRARISVEDAQKLQRQLGVAIGEAVGQQQISIGGASRAEIHSAGERLTGREYGGNQPSAGGMDRGYDERGLRG